MDMTTNPYTPGAGTPPPILAGRTALLNEAKLALNRIRIGRHAQSFVAVGLRGVGKTVIVNEVQKLADNSGYQSIYIEAYDEIRLPEVLARGLRTVLLKLRTR